MRKIVNSRLKSLKVKMRRRTSLLLRKPKKVRGKGKGRRKRLFKMMRRWKPLQMKSRWLSQVHNVEEADVDEVLEANSEPVAHC